MGIYVKGALGAFSGKVGNIVGSSWRSIDYLRSLPKPSKKAATEKQKAHRAKFALAIEFLSPMREIINIGFSDKSQKKMTAFNQATNELITKIAGEYPSFSIPYENVRFSRGSLSNIPANVEQRISGEIDVTWSTSVHRLGAVADDVVHIILYHENSQDFFVFQDAVREDGQYVVDPEGLGTGVFHIWIMVISKDGQKRSSSKYFETVEL